MADRKLIVPIPEGGAITVIYPENVTAESIEMVSNMLMAQAVNRASKPMQPPEDEDMGATPPAIDAAIAKGAGDAK